jgi:ribonuclease HI
VKRIVAATDGSRRALPGYTDCGWAWVTNEGQWYAGTIKASSILAVEVFAILHLVAVHANVDEINIGCDSKDAISLISRVRKGLMSPDEAAHSLNLMSRKDLGKFRRLLKFHGNLNLQWVPSHQGHLMNETADRLAVAARRAVDSASDVETCESIQKNIMADFASGLLVRPLAVATA